MRVGRVRPVSDVGLHRVVRAGHLQPPVPDYPAVQPVGLADVSTQRLHPYGQGMLVILAAQISVLGQEIQRLPRQLLELWVIRDQFLDLLDRARQQWRELGVEGEDRVG